MEKQLHTAFIQQLKDIYDAEHRMAESLPKFMQNAGAGEVRDALQAHLDETRNHMARLEKAFDSLGMSPERATCEAAMGIILEGEKSMAENIDSSALDALIICAAQKMEHYEIATYGTLCTWAKSMGHDDALEQLKDNLGEEKAADKKLTEVATEVANREPEHAD